MSPKIENLSIQEEQQQIQCLIVETAIKEVTAQILARQNPSEQAIKAIIVRVINALGRELAMCQNMNNPQLDELTRNVRREALLRLKQRTESIAKTHQS